MLCPIFKVIMCAMACAAFQAYALVAEKWLFPAVALTLTPRKCYFLAPFCRSDVYKKCNHVVKN